MQITIDINGHDYPVSQFHAQEALSTTSCVTIVALLRHSNELNNYLQQPARINLRSERGQRQITGIITAVSNRQQRLRKRLGVKYDDRMAIYHTIDQFL